MISSLQGCKNKISVDEVERSSKLAWAHKGPRSWKNIVDWTKQTLIRVRRIMRQNIVILAPVSAMIILFVYCCFMRTYLESNYSSLAPWYQHQSEHSLLLVTEHKFWGALPGHWHWLQSSTRAPCRARGLVWTGFRQCPLHSLSFSC